MGKLWAPGPPPKCRPDYQKIRLLEAELLNIHTEDCPCPKCERERADARRERRIERACEHWNWAYKEYGASGAMFWCSHCGTYTGCHSAWCPESLSYEEKHEVERRMKIAMGLDPDRMWPHEERAQKEFEKVFRRLELDFEAEADRD